MCSVYRRSCATACSRRSGIPLTLELAVARVRVLSPAQIAARLDNRFQLLTCGSRTALPRQQTLRALIDWSYSLLSEPEQRLFRRLAVFVNGWTLEAAAGVCSGGLETTAVLDTLSRPVDKSLVVAEDAADETRYHRLETIRQYPREKFAETDEVETVRDRHLAFYVQLCEASGAQMKAGDSGATMARLEAERDNVRAALAWGLARHPHSALRIAGSLGLFWLSSGHAAEARRWSELALESAQAADSAAGDTAPDRLAARARALSSLASAYMAHGDNQRGLAAAGESVRLYRRFPSLDPHGLSFALAMLG